MRRVFLSHTSEMRNFPVGRTFVAAAEAAVNRCGDAVADMAYFSARDEKPSDYCQEMVRRCDVYIGLIGFRYGSAVRDQPGVSYTELEFDTATRAGIQRFIFMLDDNVAAPIPPSSLLDQKQDEQLKQRAFREKLLASGVMTKSFSSSEGLELEVLQALQESKPDEPVISPGSPRRLPAHPELVGRQAEIASLVDSWLAFPPQPVAVQGAPGIGKSTLCLAALHDERVRARFSDRRRFVRCDGSKSADAVWSAIAAELSIMGEGSPGMHADRVCAALSTGPFAMVLDNFETPWMTDPLAAEELLRTIAAIPHLSLAISVRGTARPAGMRWRDPMVLSPLPQADARLLFLGVAGTGFASDPQLDDLLTELDGVPLAVELMGYAAQGQPGLQEVADRWHRERTGMLARMGGRSRELNIAVSVDTSVTAPLMTSGGRRLLALLGMLPDGIAHDDLIALLPANGRAAAAILRQLGLAFDEDERLRTLSPIREHLAASLHPEHTDLHRAVRHYAQLAPELGAQIGGRYGHEAVLRFQAETGNIAAMLEQAASAGRTGLVANAIQGLVKYWRHTGFLHAKIMAVAEQAVSAQGSPLQQASLSLAFGDLALARSDHESARSRYERALLIYAQREDLHGQADCTKSLGDIDLRRSDSSNATERYRQALALYQRVNDTLGQANCIKSLGDIDLRRSDRASASNRYEEASTLYQHVGHVLGQANCIRSLGDIELHRSETERARTRYEQALPLFIQAGGLLGQANCIKGLGDVDLRRSRHGHARERYEQALLLYRQLGDVTGQANCIRDLGDLDLRTSNHDDADGRYQQALQLFQQVGDVLGEANCIKSLGTVALGRSDFDKARALYQQALPLYQQRGSLLGEANCVKNLGVVALRQSKRGTARARFQQALLLYQATTAPYAVGWTHVRLARLATSNRTRTNHWRAARDAWTSIERQDLVRTIAPEFEHEPTP